MSSFNSVNDWIKEAKRYAPNIPYILVGNKLDLEHQRVVSKEEAEVC